MAIEIIRDKYFIIKTFFCIKNRHTLSQKSHLMLTDEGLYNDE